MNPNEMKLSYPFGETLPGAGTALDVADGVRWVRLPLPFALDHVNVWLMRDRIDGRDGWTVIDCGIANDQVKALWEQVFEQALDGLPVLRVLVTHMHPDHVGLAQWMCERWNAPLWMSMTDYVVARLWSAKSEQGSEGGAGGDAAAEHYIRHGLTEEGALAKIRRRSDYYSSMVPGVPEVFHRVMDGDQIEIGGRQWRVIIGYGHAPEHISLYCEATQVLIAGDMVLPRISTNVSVFSSEPMADPLRLYLESLSAYDDLPVETLALPSHGRPFRGVHERISQQHEHHADRLAEVMVACEQPKTAADILPVLFRRELDYHQLTFAMGEAIAHLHALYFQGRLRRVVDKDGIIRCVVA